MNHTKRGLNGSSEYFPAQHLVLGRKVATEAGFTVQVLLLASNIYLQ